MTKTLINLDPDDKAWLDVEARTRKLPMTELVRRAVHQYRVCEESRSRLDLVATLESTAGIWRHGDGLAYQQRMRREWNDRE